MAFVKGQSGNPGGRAIRVKDGRKISEIAREHTEEAIETLVEVMRDRQSPAAARVAAADKILNRGWGQAPQTIAVTDDREPRDMSSLTNKQLEAIETLRMIDALDTGTAGSC